jgi:hypothetical protein
MNTVQRRVSNGVNWLNRYSPGWRDKIAINELEMSSTCSCIIGQVFGDYMDVIDSIDQDMGINGGIGKKIPVDDLLSHEEAVSLGFDIGEYDDSEDMDFMTSEGQYEVLKTAWLKELGADDGASTYREQRWEEAPHCNLDHYYDDEGWRPSMMSSRTHQHLVVVEVRIGDFQPDL